LWLVEVVLKIRKMGATIWQARKHEIPVPYFSGTSFGAEQGPAVSTVLSILAGGSVGAIFWYAHFLFVKKEDWFTPLVASAYVLVFGTAVLMLAFRGFQRVSAAPYDRLEREIIFESLSAPQIRERFVRNLIGPTAAEWLVEQTSLLKAVNEDLEKKQAAIAESLKTLETGTGKAVAEKKDEVAKLLRELGEALLLQKESAERQRFLIGEFAHSLGGQPSEPRLSLVLTEWRGQLDPMVKAAQAGSEVRRRLVALSQSLS
jgi:hypothetical protein